MSRADEIAQGLREPSGCLTFPLDALEYGQGHVDFAAGNPPPKFSSASYDLGRARAREAREEDNAFKDYLRAEDERRDAAMCDILKDRPDLLADYQTKIAAIRSA